MPAVEDRQYFSKIGECNSHYLATSVLRKEYCHKRRQFPICGNWYLSLSLKKRLRISVFPNFPLSIVNSNIKNFTQATCICYSPSDSRMQKVSNFTIFSETSSFSRFKRDVLSDSLAIHICLIYQYTLQWIQGYTLFYRENWSLDVSLLMC